MKTTITLIFLLLPLVASAQVYQQPNYGDELGIAQGAKNAAQSSCGFYGCTLDPNLVFSQTLQLQMNIDQQRAYEAQLAIEIAKIQQQVHVTVDQANPYAVGNIGLPIPGSAAPLYAPQFRADPILPGRRR